MYRVNRCIILTPYPILTGGGKEKDFEAEEEDFDPEKENSERPADDRLIRTTRNGADPNKEEEEEEGKQNFLRPYGQQCRAAGGGGGGGPGAPVWHTVPSRTCRAEKGIRGEIGRAHV